MSYSNSKITPPIDLIGDVDRALGLSTGDVKTACMGGVLTTTCKINMWSKYKPLRGGTYYTDIQSGSNWKDTVDTTYNCGIIYTPGPVNEIHANYINSNFTKFYTYNRLTTNDWGRLTDFNEYYHQAISPFGSSFIISSGASRLTGTNNYTTVLGNLVTFTLLDSIGAPGTSTTNVLVEDLGYMQSTSHLIGGWYFGIENGSHFATSNLPVVRMSLNNRIYSYALVLDTSTNLNTGITTTFYPIICESKGTEGTDPTEIYLLTLTKSVSSSASAVGIDNNSSKMNSINLSIVAAAKIENNAYEPTSKMFYEPSPDSKITGYITFKSYLTTNELGANKPSITEIKAYVHKDDGSDWWDDDTHKPKTGASYNLTTADDITDINPASDYNNPTVISQHPITYINVSPDYDNYSIQGRIVARYRATLGGFRVGTLDITLDIPILVYKLPS